MRNKENAGFLMFGQIIFLGILLGAVCLFSACGREEAVFTAGGQAEEWAELSGAAWKAAEAGIVKESDSEEAPEVQSEVWPKAQSEITPEAQTEALQEAAGGLESLVVYVCGQVNHPGVYELESGARIADAVELAGGMTNEAASDVLNLAQTIRDEQMIRVPSLEEVKEQGAAALAGIQMEDTWSQKEEQSGKGQETSGSGKTDGRISLNKATKEQLMTLPGIGEAKADAILAYRQERGGFGSVEELMNISGIKEGVFSKIKDYITV